ncbi:hypothetical protein RIR_jg34778.t1 [Rhizophagus irregularis DAOM 181602=DAOM 197198]|nr:hypothetical protein RIR_jg34778.t1 [Rhizophagus irregularis DAOM 181602=DAOM 197198]
MDTIWIITRKIKNLPRYDEIFLIRSSSFTICYLERRQQININNNITRVSQKIIHVREKERNFLIFF